ncbi:zinc transporter 1-like isoform X2 [Carica papaya]|uniref:zinc transporter 1-like isoform X2 n=1 Tax=Carica papaya TaxID=3649 RepID=UPI000B8D19A4|nr:zinc transporter 1-like isoform X2 [Carica papaya]
MNAKFLILFCWILLLVSKHVGADCTCDPEENTGDKGTALKYKIGAIFSILVAGAIGVCLPVLGKTIPALHPEKNIFFIIKAFAAGVILSTGFIHVLPDAFKKLTSPCLKGTAWGFPFTGFIAMVSAIVTLMIDAFATSYYQKSAVKRAGTHAGDEEKVRDESGNSVQVHTHATHGHAHGSISLVADSQSELLRHRVISQVLELGIIVHSVIIGISLGASEDVDTVRTLLGALTFHQFFEGMGLGGCISQLESQLESEYQMCTKKTAPRRSLSRESLTQPRLES